MLLLLLAVPSTLLLALLLYIRLNDRRLTAIPNTVLALSPSRCTAADVRATATRLAASPPISITAQTGPRTGRRYIIVGGGGFVGGWIASELIDRGEALHRIRLVDVHPPGSSTLKNAMTGGVQFIKADIVDPIALQAAFAAPWPAAGDTGDVPPETTVFHTASSIRFFERSRVLFDKSARVNVDGTRNVISAAQATGVSILIYTSSGSVGVQRTRFFLWPWQTEPRHFVQVLNDDDAAKLALRSHSDFFSNYAATKWQAECLVRAADRSPTGVLVSQEQRLLRTGCIRPGNAVFGARGDSLCGAFLERGTNPTWIGRTVQSFVYVQNCAAAHLNYEQRLLDLAAGKPHPDIGGQSFVVSDPGPPLAYGDIYKTLSTLSGGRCTFPEFSPTFMYIISHLFEFLHILRHRLLATKKAWRWFGHLVPPLSGDLIHFQPSVFALLSVHIVFDDSRARMSPEKGGLGYKGAWTTYEGVHKVHQEYESGEGLAERRSHLPGITFGFKKREKESKKMNVRGGVVQDKLKDVVETVERVNLRSVEMLAVN